MVNAGKEGGGIVESFLFGNEPVLKKLAVFIFLIIVVLIVVIALESAMGLVSIGRLERQVNILHELSSLSEAGLGDNSELRLMFKSAAEDLENFDPDLGLTVSKFIPKSNENQLLEIISTASSWILVGLMLLFVADGGWRMRLFLCITTAVIGVVIGCFVSEIIETPNQFWTVVSFSILGFIPLVFTTLYFYNRLQRLKKEQGSRSKKSRGK
ncbi:MAG: hypothetical protein OXG39_20145 [Chloroflexi bacterium]|nr:hypothetical protein [Chloroflexota bacterium]